MYHFQNSGGGFRPDGCANGSNDSTAGDADGAGTAHHGEPRRISVRLFDRDVFGLSWSWWPFNRFVGTDRCNSDKRTIGCKRNPAGGPGYKTSAAPCTSGAANRSGLSRRKGRFRCTVDLDSQICNLLKLRPREAGGAPAFADGRAGRKSRWTPEVVPSGCTGWRCAGHVFGDFTHTASPSKPHSHSMVCSFLEAADGEGRFAAGRVGFQIIAGRVVRRWHRGRRSTQR